MGKKKTPPASPPADLAGAIEGLQRLKDEHRPLLAEIAGDPGMAPAVRQSLIAHLYTEEDERLAEIAALKPTAPKGAAAPVRASDPRVTVGSLRPGGPPRATVGSLRDPDA